MSSSNFPAGPGKAASVILRLRGCASTALTIVRNRIWRWSEAIEVIPTVFICRELTTQVVLDLIGVLLLVQTVGRRLPHLHHGARDGFLGDVVDDSAMHVGYFAIFHPRHEAVPILPMGSVLTKERAQNGGCGRRI
jgi:hypothetical protein